MILDGALPNIRERTNKQIKNDQESRRIKRSKINSTKE
jgi:hypothetical protein